MNSIKKFSSRFSQSVKATCLLLALAFHSFGQSGVETGVQFSSIVTASGFGTVYVPGFFVAKKNVVWEVGAAIQKKNLNVCGAHLGFEYTVFNGATTVNDEYSNEHLELFFSAQTNYLQDASLSKAAIRREELVSRHKDIKPDFRSLKFNVMEVYAGFGLRYKINPTLKLSGSIGFGGWNTFKGQRNLDRSNTDFGLLVKSSLYVNLWRSSKTRTSGRTRF